MKKNILMVVNPISGDMDKAEFTDTAKLFAEKEGMDFFVYETTGKNDEQKIREACKEHKRYRVLIA